MLAFTFDASSLTSALYLPSSFSSSVTLAFTIAMLSFIRGTWSFMSRMFCSRMSSGSSATEMKNPKNERNIRDSRLNMGCSSSRFSARVVSQDRRGAAAGPVVIGFSATNGATASAIRRSSCCFCSRQVCMRSRSLATVVVVGLDLGAQLIEDAVRLLLQLLVLVGLLGLELIQGALLNGLERIDRAVAPDRVFDDFLQLHSRRVERQQHRTAFDLNRQGANVLALEHVRNLEDGEAVAGGRDFGRLVDLFERGRVRNGLLELGQRLHGGRNLGDCLGGAGGATWRGLLAVRFPRRRRRSSCTTSCSW